MSRARFDEAAAGNSVYEFLTASKSLLIKLRWLVAAVDQDAHSKMSANLRRGELQICNSLLAGVLPRPSKLGIRAALATGNIKIPVRIRIEL
jgi:hypothetical protein